MGVSLESDGIITEWGAPDFVHALFSNIAYHLENGRWGSRYPALMEEFYQGELSAKSVDAALTELKDIMFRFASVPTSEVIWDIEDLSKRPPWGTNIAPTVTDLSNYFVTSNGFDLFSDFEECLESASLNKQSVKLVNL